MLLILILFFNTYTNPLSKHNDSYMISGDPDTKIKFSFKYGFTDWKLDLYLAYTQAMFWDLKKESKPFSDVNYNPELFYRLWFDNLFINFIDIGLYEHKSNGKAGDDSRSYDMCYLKFSFLFNLYSKTFLSFINKFYYLYRLDNTNLDIREYIGFYDASIRIHNIDLGSVFISTYFSWFAGGEKSNFLNKGAKTVGVSLSFFNLKPSIFLEFYDGYNESLLKYNKKETAYRIGLIF